MTSKVKEPTTHSASSGSSAGKQPTTMEELLAMQTAPITNLRRRQVVEATIIKISEREMILDLGGKAEGVVSGKELENENLSAFTIGDKIPVTIMQTDADNDYIVCSLQVLTDTRKLTSLQEAFDSEEPVEVKVVEERKGGFLVNINGVRGFLPASQVALDYIGKAKDLIGKAIMVKVIEFDADTPRLIVSQKAVVSENEQDARKAFFEKAQVGDEVEGTVVAVLPFGLVVNVQSVEGFVHISEIAWERVDNPGSYFKVGDTLKAAITNILSEEGKITLSVKQLAESPWAMAEKIYTDKEPVKGTVTRRTPQGFLVRLDSGIVGLVPKEQVSDDTSFTDGSQVTVTIESVDLERKRATFIPIKG